MSEVTPLHRLTRRLLHPGRTAALAGMLLATIAILSAVTTAAGPAAAQGSAGAQPAAPGAGEPEPPWHDVPYKLAGAGALLFLLGAGVYAGRTVALRRRSRQLEGLVAERTRELEEANARLARANAELEATVTELDNAASTDRLTGCWNRRQLERAVEVEVGRSRRSHDPLSLVLFDLDHFKQVNDRYGHQVGDAVLVEMVERVTRTIRVSDSLTRWGGEEFVVLAPLTGLTEAVATAERLRQVVAGEPFRETGPLTATFGVAEWLPDEDFQSLLRRADRALYAAKLSGRNRVLWDPAVAPWTSKVPPEAPVLQLVWRDSYACGNPVIDTQHRALFLLANRVISCLLLSEECSDLGPSLDRLLEHIERHFEEEEGILREHCFPELERHRQLHAELLERAKGMAAALRSGEAEVEVVMRFLVGRVVAEHMLGADREFFPTLRVRGTAAATVGEDPDLSPETTS
jgi:diguanylate cyclase (GGDEF)-like protein/hemerythrin-like metal-binding protein